MSGSELAAALYLSVPYPRVWSRKPERCPPRPDPLRCFQYPILGSGHGNRPRTARRLPACSRLSVPYPRVWSRKPTATRSAATSLLKLSVPYPRVWSRKPLADGEREETHLRLSVPYPRVWSRKPARSSTHSRLMASAFSTLSSGLVTETRHQAMRQRDTSMPFSTLSSGLVTETSGG